MKLYHGTSLYNLSGIIELGLSPDIEIIRTDNRSVNQGVIYLTDCHPTYYAWRRCVFDGSARAAILEIETDSLPEEDFIFDDIGLEERGRTLDQVEGTIDERLKYFRRFVNEGKFQDIHWTESLTLAGTVGYRGVIPSSKIERIIVIDAVYCEPEVFGLVDPTITAMTHHIHRSRNLRRLARVLKGEFPDTKMYRND